MTPAMIAALAQQRASATGFFEITLPSGVRRLMIGSGEVAYAGNTWKGYDSTIGSISGGDGIREDASGDAPNTSISIQVAATATKSDIAGAAVQLSPVKISLAALTLDGSNHLIAIADPEQLFDGFIDQATSNIDQKKDEVSYTIISAFDYFFEDSEGQRLSPQFHHTVWPAATNEKGLDNVTGVSRKIYWGTYGPGGAGGVLSGGGGAGAGSYGAGGYSSRGGLVGPQPV